MGKDKAASRAELKRAREDLERVSKRDRRETDDYARANGRAADAEKRVSWWRR